MGKFIQPECRVLLKKRSPHSNNLQWILQILEHCKIYWKEIDAARY